jgi:hypothetical protein
MSQGELLWSWPPSPRPSPWPGRHGLLQLQARPGVDQSQFGDTVVIRQFLRLGGFSRSTRYISRETWSTVPYRVAAKCYCRPEERQCVTVPHAGFEFPMAAALVQSDIEDSIIGRVGMKPVAPISSLTTARLREDFSALR